MTVTLFPEARFSSRRVAAIFSGTGSSAGPSVAAQWQAPAGQPQRGQRRPFSVE